MSNSFPKVSPDGRWIVYTKCRNGLLMRPDGRLWIKLPTTRQPGSTVDLTVSYGGRPRVAPRAPWNGGFQWNRTPSGAPWIATTCQGEGADIWWPVKDHVSDEPDQRENERDRDSQLE